MATVSWKFDADGNWSTPSNWSTGALPGSTVDVQISTAHAHTITHGAGNDTVRSLTVSANDALAMTGGTLAVLGNSSVGGALSESAGTLRFGGANSTVIGALTQSAGTISVDSGTLHLRGTGGSFAGTLRGSAVDFQSGSDTLAAGLTVDVGTVLISGATVTLGGNLTANGVWAQTAGALQLGANTLTLGSLGVARLDGGSIDGTGTLVVAGTTDIGTWTVRGGVSVRNTGLVREVGSMRVGVAAADTIAFTNAAAGIFDIDNSATITGTALAQFTNAGRMFKDGAGEARVGVSATTTGTLEITAGVLSFTGPSNSFGHIVRGAGTLDLAGGDNTFLAGLQLSTSAVVLENAGLTLGGNLTYANTWSQTNGTLSLDGHRLTLTGDASFDGGIVTTIGGVAGTLTTTGATEISGLFLEGASLLRNGGDMTQTATWHLGLAAGDSARLVNLAAGTITIVANTDITGPVSSLFTNQGALVKRGGGTSAIATRTVSDGSITVRSGVLSFTGAGNTIGGAVDGAGTLQFSVGSTTLDSGLSLSVGNVLLAGAQLTLGADLSYGGTYVQSFGTLALDVHTLTLGASASASLNGGSISGSGTLAVAGNVEVSGVALAGGMVLQIDGVGVQTDLLVLSAAAGKAPELLIAAGSQYAIANNADIVSGAADSTLVNAGLLAKTTGADLTSIGVATINTGVVLVGSGTMAFMKSVSGTGDFGVGFGATLKFAGAVDAGTAVSLSGANSSLFVSATNGFAGSIAGFSNGDFIELTGMSFTNATLAFNAGTDVLTAANGATSVALQLIGTHSASDFRLFSDNGIAAIAHT